MIRLFTLDDYEEAYELWRRIPGYLYHTCVDELHRQKSIGRELVINSGAH